MLKRLYQTGFAAYAVMFIFSLLFYKERTIFLDTAFNLFYIINKPGFAIQIFRFGDIPSQLLPYLATIAGLGLNTILMVYSAGFVVLYAAAYTVCGSLLKRYDFALVILILSVLFTAHTFYWMLSQLPQAIAMLMVVFALAGRKNTLVHRLVIATLLITIVFFHPLVFFVLAFSLAFFHFGGYDIIEKKTAMFIASAYAAGFLIKFTFFKTPYEAHSMSGLKNFIHLFPNYFTIYSNAQFLRHGLTLYYWLPVFFVVITAWYRKRRAWNKLWLFTASFVGYLALVNITYATSATPAFYIENLYTPLAVFIALPLIFDILPTIRMRVALPVALLILVTCCVRIYATHSIYSGRLAYERNILDTYGERKVIVTATPADSSALIMIWGNPYEFLLLAESERHKTASIIIDPQPDLRIFAGSRRDALVVNYNIIPYATLNHRYFQFPDTVNKYEIIKNR